MQDNISSEDGQTTVEYILMLVVVMIFAYTVFKVMRDRTVGANGECNPGDEAFLCKIEAQIDGLAAGGYRYYRL